MKKRQVYIIISLLSILTVIALLVTGSSLLTLALFKDNAIPLGTFITWTGMFSLPLTIYWGIKALRKPTNKLQKHSQ
ncbi:hypothetical protein [Winogradskyella aquimaris]|uniref:DUF2798 domain-containing protein n=1 Tax=Winogradskyella aquimaris TaxID=864074 RepID=A0ABU5EQG1_9FLAO|nr:hypothetical protein [Winogradskyella aquimaris]MDY2587955.1 hypothetical protein [Winogradskyella aquimaris]